MPGSRGGGGGRKPRHKTKGKKARPEQPRGDRDRKRPSGPRPDGAGGRGPGQDGRDSDPVPPRRTDRGGGRRTGDAGDPDRGGGRRTGDAGDPDRGARDGEAGGGGGRPAGGGRSARDGGDRFPARRSGGRERDAGGRPTGQRRDPPLRDRPGDEEVPKEWLVARLDARGRFLQAHPYFVPGRPFVVDRVQGADDGLLALLRMPRPGRREPVRIARVLGRPDVARVVLEALMLDRGLARRFPPGIQRAAEEARDALAAGEDDPAGGTRRDLRELPTFTIDPVTARDFDDAISAERLEDGRARIWVHIADVSAFVRPGSPVDREAYRRGTSVYVPGLVEPMLPEALSNEACSLKPGVPRLAVTVEMDFDGATVTRMSAYRSEIRSDERLDYDQVDRILAGDEPVAEPWGTPLAVAREVAAALEARRAQRGALAVDSREPEFAFDADGHVREAVLSEQTESHRLVEHLMIAANEQVATLLAERKVPALYRVHERPDAVRVRRLLDQLAALGVPTPSAPQELTPQQAAEVVGEASRLVAEHVARVGHGRMALTSLVLRSLKQAVYTPENKGHAGLHSERYCHFTSPIRRYPDLICHRALLSAVGGGEDAPRPGAMTPAGEWCSGRERDAMGIERAADAVAQAFLLERRLFEHGWEEVFAGEVVGLIGAGAFVTFGDGYEGMLPVRRLKGAQGQDDWWELDELATTLRGERTGTTLRLGDPVSVVVHGIEVARGRVDLDRAPDTSPGGGYAARPKRRRAAG